MKVLAMRDEPAFNPIVLSITLETAKEAEVFYSIFNNTKLCDWMRESGFDPKDIRQQLTQVRSEDDDYHRFTMLHTLHNLLTKDGDF